MATYGNFATWNPLISELNSSRVYADGNRKVTLNNADDGAETTMFVPAGSKGYCEITVDTNAAAPTVGIRRSDSQTTLSSTNLSGALEYGYRSNGQKRGGGASAASYGNTFTAGDVIGVAIDTVAGAVWFSKNGTWQASATIGEVNAGTTTNAAFTGLAGFGYTFAVANSSSGTTGDSFTGNFGATDFAYTQPTGFIALSTANLPEPSPINYQDEYYILAGIVHTTGTTTDVHLPKTVSGGAMVRIKRTDATGSWYGFDTVRGANKSVRWDVTEAESTNTFDDQNLTGTTFTMPSDLASGTYLLECFYVGSYFQIKGFVGDHPTVQTLSYGSALDSAPGFMVFFNRDGSTQERTMTYHVSTGNASRLDISDSVAAASSAGAFGSFTPTTTQFKVGNEQNSNQDNANIISYHWANSGPYAFGSYTGNGNVSGPVSLLNGYPMTVIFKSAGANNWEHIDGKRNLVNPRTQYLLLGTTSAEDADISYDALSNGFKLRTTTSAGNSNTQVYLYLAFGIQPSTDAGINQARAAGSGSSALLSVATGGTITLDGDYAINTFNASGAIIFSKAPVDLNITVIG